MSKFDCEDGRKVCSGDEEVINDRETSVSGSKWTS